MRTATADGVGSDNSDSVRITYSQAYGAVKRLQTCRINPIIVGDQIVD
jgi:hypothetical protein